MYAILFVGDSVKLKYTPSAEVERAIADIARVNVMALDKNNIHLPSMQYLKHELTFLTYFWS